MKRTYAFRSRTKCKASGEFIDVLVVFFGRAEVDMNVLDDEIQNYLKTNDPPPHALLLVSFEKYAKLLIRAWQENKTRADFLWNRGQRKGLGYLKEIGIWQFEDGSFRKAYRYQQSTQNYDLDVSDLWREGLAQLVDARNVFQEAPPGHIFKHPSGRATHQFLLASKLLSDEVDAYFVAMAICATVWDRLKKTTTLHIDTMGIYPIARAVENITRLCGGSNQEWGINNFHSYREMEGLYTAVDDTDAVLVSASTSGAMVKKLYTEKVPEEALITLLDMSDEGRYGTVVYARNRHADSPNSGRTQRTQNETVIQLDDEYFAAQGKKPRPFVLTKDHKPDSLQPLLDNFSKSSVLQLNHAHKGKPARNELVWLDEAAVAVNSKMKEWLKDEIRLKTPASVSHIIGLEGKSRNRMAPICVKILEKIAGRKPKLLDNLTTLSKADIKEVTGVLVCGAVVGNGHTLRSIARDLREKVPEASRHFVVAVGLPETRQAWVRLKQFLTQSGDKERPYLLSSWQVLPTGASSEPSDAWQRAIKLMQSAQHMRVDDLSWPKDVTEESISLMGKDLDSHQRGYLTTISGQPLKLTRGFVFWNPCSQTRTESDNAAVSFLAMSSALQNAREHDVPGSRLSSSLHETVVLDVENFLRYNDGVLQASLLRAADAHELDYSGSPELSEILREFLEKVFLNACRQYGDASLEFGLALATQRLRLTKEDSIELVKRIKDQLSKPSVLHGFIYAWMQSINDHSLMARQNPPP